MSRQRNEKSKSELKTKLKLLESSLDNDACEFEYNQCVTSNSETRKELQSYYKAHFKNYNPNSFSNYEEFLDKLIFQFIPILVTKTCVIRIYLNLNFIWLFQVWKTRNFLVAMVSLKSFMFFFWDKIKELFINSSRTALEKKELSILQRQAIIKLIEK